MRFAVAVPIEIDNRRESPGSLSQPSLIRLIYVCERNHRPVERGELEFDLQGSRWLRRHDDARLQKMAECFLGSFLQKRS